MVKISRGHFQAILSIFHFLAMLSCPPPPVSQHGLLAQLNMARNMVMLGVNHTLFRRSLLVLFCLFFCCNSAFLWICVHLYLPHADFAIAVNCPAGQQTIGIVCGPCPVGTYKATSGVRPCNDCPSERLTPTTGSTSRDQCSVRKCAHVSYLRCPMMSQT